MSSFLGTNSNKWDVNMVRSIFNPKVVAKILKIQLGLTQRHDKWIWSMDKHGNFGVMTNDEYANALILSPIWKQI